jgi:DNA polymerase/3'-5' exonuclease PolX
VELEKARAIAEELKNGLEGACHRIEIVGDIRRGKPRVRKIKLLCIPTPVEGVSISPEDLLFRSVSSQKWLPEWGDSDAVDDCIMDMRQQGILEWTSGSGPNRAAEKSVIHRPSGTAVEIVSTNERCWPVALVLATGGPETIKAIAAAARQKGWRFRPSGDGFDTPGGHITCKTEREVFETVGLSCLLPEQRE